MSSTHIFLKRSQTNGYINFLTEVNDGRNKQYGILRLHFAPPKKPELPKMESTNKKTADSLRIILYQRLNIPFWEIGGKEVIVTNTKLFGIIVTQAQEYINIASFVVSKAAADQLKIEIQTTDHKNFYGTLNFEQTQYPDSSVRLYFNGRQNGRFVYFTDLFYTKVVKAGETIANEDTVFGSKSFAITN